MITLHPRIDAASRGELPPWADVDKKRRAHMRRVAELLGEWADRQGLDAAERSRRVAMGFLHDTLKGASAESLRALLDPPMSDLPAPVLHGPAAAELLAREGVEDSSVLQAIRYHTLGHAGLDPAGRALYAADFLEPGRNLRNKWRAALRERMPDEEEDVVREIVRARIKHLLARGRPVRPETVGFWNSLTRGASWARASEV